MRERICYLFIVQIFALIILLPLHSYAVSEGIEKMMKGETFVNQALDQAKEDLKKAKTTYEQFHEQWLDAEESVKAESKLAYRDIETQMGQVEYAFMITKQQEVIAALQSLHQVLERFNQGQYDNGAELKETAGTLSDFIILLQQTKEGCGASNEINTNLSCIVNLILCH